MLRKHTLQTRQQHCRSCRLVDELAVGARTFQLGETAIDDERDIALLQRGANVRCCYAIVHGVIDDGSSQGRSHCLVDGILERARDYDVSASTLERVGNV